MVQEAGRRKYILHPLAIKRAIIRASSKMHTHICPQIATLTTQAYMDAAVGMANWLVGKLLTKLSNDLVAAYVASLELGHNFQDIQRKLLYIQGLLHAGQWRDVSHNPGLQGLLLQLSKTADEAEDALDELHYFMIQDQLDGTQEATVQEPAPEMGDVIHAHARHGRHAIGYTLGNCLRCFSCSPTKNDDCTVTSDPHDPTQSHNHNDDGHVDKLPFNRVEMSIKIKLLIEDIHSLCDPISNLLDKIPNNSTAIPLTRPQRGSAIVQDKLYGRGAIFEKTVDDITSCCETLSVLPVVGSGGIGKTTFTQHLYSDTRTKEHFTVRVWVCVSTNFDVLELTKQILSCIPSAENEGSNPVNETGNLSKLQEYTAERLKSKRFLVVLDDVWKCDSKEDWETLIAPFTKGQVKGSMFLVTTRFPKLADMVKTVDPIELQGLDGNEFLTLFEACIFGEHNKPGYYEDQLSGTAREIANKLKGSPLAAKTVGRLLKKNSSHEHWKGVLQKYEWLNQANNDDIMPSLKISYDYLPYDLKKCFSYFSLFPEDHRFNNLEMNRFWIAVGIIDSSHQGDENYLEELVDNGFLMKEVDRYGQYYYVMHDLMHELSRSISSQECLNISGLDFRVSAIPQSIRHLSITIENMYDEKFGEEMGKLKGRIDIKNLRTLMIFVKYEERITEILKDTFQEINGLRVLFIALGSLEPFPHSFPRLIHLQYLKISSPYATEMILPSALSRFYHLKFLDLEDWHGSFNLPKGFNRLVSLREFTARNELHSSVAEVGKMKCLQELQEFHVKKEIIGFELRELGELTELGGQLSICNLETVASKEEASEAKLMSKGNLKELRLVWGIDWHLLPFERKYADVIDALKPHCNLRALGIVNYPGTTGPSWLCVDVRVESLSTLHLEAVSSATLPPFWQLPHLKNLSLEKVSGLRQFGPDYGGVTGKCFMHLKSAVLRDMPELVEWVVEPDCHMFPRLESIICSNCPKLSVMPFSEYSCTGLCSLHISGCPRLSLPPMPHTSTLTNIIVRGRQIGSHRLDYNGKSLRVTGYNSALALHNMEKVEHLSIHESLIPFADGRRHEAICKLFLGRWGNIDLEELDDSVTLGSVRSLELQYGSYLTGKLLSKMLNYLPALSEFKISCQNEKHVELAIQFPSLSPLKNVSFCGCKGLVFVPAKNGGGTQEHNSSLRSVKISECGRLFRGWPMGEAPGGAQTIKPFPASLRELDVEGESSIRSMALLSNLKSLTYLRLVNCVNLSADGFNPLIAVNLKELLVFEHRQGGSAPYSIAADLLSEMARSIPTMPAASFRLEVLEVDSISAVLVPPVCGFLASTLRSVAFMHDERVESFTQEQDQALQLLTSLQKLKFFCCEGLRSLPQGLHRLSSLKELEVRYSSELRSLPVEGFPASLRKLNVWGCSDECQEQIENLKGRNPALFAG